MGNLVVVLALQFLIQAPRPLDINRFLLEFECIDPDTSGFPAVDSHMAVVVLLPAVLHTQSVPVQLVFLTCILYLGFTRVFIGMRFMTQVVGSWLTGITGVLVANRVHLMLKAYKIPAKYNHVAFVFVLLAFVAIIAFWIENNESRVLGVKKNEYLRVMESILTTDPLPSAAAASSADNLHTKAKERATTAHTLEQQLLLLSRRRRMNEAEAEDEEELEEELAGKKDSFYYLMRGMQRRARYGR